MINTALNYTGSKFKLLEQIIPELDYSKSTFVDLFCGSFVVGSNVVEFYEKIIGNDIIKDVIEIHKGIIYDHTNFISKVKHLSVSKEDINGFNLLRKSYNESKSPEKLYALILCSTNNMIRFNQKFDYNQTFGKRTFNSSIEQKLNNYIKFIEPFKNKLFFQSNHFSDVEIDNSSMVYIDPPYARIRDINGDITNKQISEAGYNCFFKKEDDIKLYEYITNLNNKNISFMISGLLEHNGMTSWIMSKLISDGFRYKELDFNYNKVSKSGEKSSREIIIMNYERK